MRVFLRPESADEIVLGTSTLLCRYRGAITREIPGVEIPVPQSKKAFSILLGKKFQRVDTDNDDIGKVYNLQPGQFSTSST